MPALKLYHLVVLLHSLLSTVVVAIEDDADAITTTAAVAADVLSTSLRISDTDTSSKSVFSAGLLVKAESADAFAAGLQGDLSTELCSAFSIVTDLATARLVNFTIHNSRRLRGSAGHFNDRGPGRALSSISGFSLMFQAEVSNEQISGGVSSQSLAQALWENFLAQLNSQVEDQHKLSSLLQATAVLDSSDEIEFSLELLHAAETSTSGAELDWEAGTIAAILCMTMTFLGSVAVGACYFCGRLTARVEEEQRLEREAAQEAAEDSDDSEDELDEEAGATVGEGGEAESLDAAAASVVAPQPQAMAHQLQQQATSAETVVELEAVHLGLQSSVRPATHSLPSSHPVLPGASSSAAQAVSCQQPPPLPEETSTDSSTGDEAVARMYSSGSDPSWERTPATSAGLPSWPIQGPTPNKEASVEAQTEADTSSPSSEVRSSLPVSLCPTNVSSAPTEV